MSNFFFINLTVRLVSFKRKNEKNMRMRQHKQVCFVLMANLPKQNNPHRVRSSPPKGEGAACQHHLMKNSVPAGAKGRRTPGSMCLLSQSRKLRQGISLQNHWLTGMQWRHTRNALYSVIFMIFGCLSLAITRTGTDLQIPLPLRVELF